MIHSLGDALSSTLLLLPALTPLVGWGMGMIVNADRRRLSSRLDEVARTGDLGGLQIEYWDRGGPPGPGYESDQLVLKVMPKLRGIETSGDSKRNCLDPIRKQLENADLGLGLAEDFDIACRVGHGAFVWNSARYLENAE